MPEREPIEKRLIGLQSDLQSLLNNPNIPEETKVNTSAYVGQVLAEEFMGLSSDRFAGSFFLFGFFTVTDPRLFSDKRAHPFSDADRMNAKYADGLAYMRNQMGEEAEILIRLMERSKEAGVLVAQNLLNEGKAPSLDIVQRLSSSIKGVEWVIPNQDLNMLDRESSEVYSRMLHRKLVLWFVKDGEEKQS